MIGYILKASLENGRIITIVYRKGDELTQRDIKILAIEGERIKAHCYLRGSIRIFSFNNILSASFAQESSGFHKRVI